MTANSSSHVCADMSVYGFNWNWKWTKSYHFTHIWSRWLSPVYASLFLAQSHFSPQFVMSFENDLFVCLRHFGQVKPLTFTTYRWCLNSPTIRIIFNNLASGTAYLVQTKCVSCVNRAVLVLSGTSSFPGKKCWKRNYNLMKTNKCCRVTSMVPVANCDTRQNNGHHG